MKASEIDFRFPVLAFTPDGDIWGFPDAERLSKCGPRTLKDKAQDGMELIDAEGRRWRVLSVKRTGAAGFSFWIFGQTQSRIDQELEPLAPLSLEEIQQRSCQAMEHVRIDYYGEEGEAEYNSTLKDISRTKNISEIYELLQPDTFEPN